MLHIKYIEDIFIIFYEHLLKNKILPESRDRNPLKNFYNIFVMNKKITYKQSQFVLKLLGTYQNILENIDSDLLKNLENPKWKNEFRIVDHGKKVFVELKDNDLFICLKFPYSLVKSFENTLSEIAFSSFWDRDHKVRKIKLTNQNIFVIDDFIRKHSFEIDNTYDILLSKIEEIYSNQEKYRKISDIRNNKVILINADDFAKTYFSKHRKGNIEQDLFLAKTMGYPALNNNDSMFRRLCSSKENYFFIENLKKFFEISQVVDGKVCIILDKNSEIKTWIEQFYESYINNNIKDKVTVCFRESNKNDAGFNDWIRKINFNTKLSESKFYIFRGRPPKWLFREDINVSIIATNHLMMPFNTILKDLMISHPCNIFLGEFKPTLHKGFKIVNL